MPIRHSRALLLHLLSLPPRNDLVLGTVLHLVETRVVAAAVALEGRGRFERVDHEAETGTGGGDHGRPVGAGTAGCGVGHL